MIFTTEQWNKLRQDVSNIKITLNNIDKKLDNILTKDSAPKGPPIIKNPFEKLDEFTTFDESLLNNDELQLKLVSSFIFVKLNIYI